MTHPVWMGHASAGPPPLVVIVDPSEDMRRVLSLLLEHAGYETAGTADPDEALRLVRARTPALVVGEHPLPVRGGRPLCEVLLDDPLTAGIPFIAVTARAFQEDLDSARRTHAHGVLTKPVELRRIMDRVQELLRTAGA